MTSAGDDRVVRVGIGLIARDGRYLVRRRLPGQIMSGVWEFPGGKCLEGEDARDAAERECLEEVGLDVQVDRLRTTILHRYPHGAVELSYYDCRLRDPAAEPPPETGFRWVHAADLATLEFPGANAPVIDALALEAKARD